MRCVDLISFLLTALSYHRLHLWCTHCTFLSQTISLSYSLHFLITNCISGVPTALSRASHLAPIYILLLVKIALTKWNHVNFIFHFLCLLFVLKRLQLQCKCFFTFKKHIPHLHYSTVFTHILTIGDYKFFYFM